MHAGSRTSTIAVSPPRFVCCLALGLGLLVGGPLACRPSPEREAESVQAVTGIQTPASEGPSCPSEQLREARAPEVRPEHEHAAYWLAKYDAEARELVLLDADDRAALDAKVAELPGGWRDPLAEAGADPELVTRELDERLAWIRDRVDEGKYVEREPDSFAAAMARVESASLIEGLPARVVVVETPLWCIPMREGLFTEPVDLDFDRNRCASLHPGELVRTLRQSGEWIYVEAGHSVGWIDHAGGPRLGPALGLDEARALRESRRAYLLEDVEALRAGTQFRFAEPEPEPASATGLLVPTLEGFETRALDQAQIHEGPLPFTRRAVFEQAFTMLDQPYGWGGRDGQRDCSRYTHDLFAQFGVRLARNSGVQAKLGTRSVDVAELDEDAKREAIREAARAGVVLLYMPGHIMLYLGHEGDYDYGISALSEYLTPCEGGPDTVHRLDKVAVTTLDLGRGTERSAFIERITRLAVFD